MIDFRELVENLKKLKGLPPYDGPSNSVRGDEYFALSLEKKYGMSIDKLEKLAGLK